MTSSGTAQQQLHPASGCSVANSTLLTTAEGHGDKNSTVASSVSVSEAPTKTTTRSTVTFRIPPTQQEDSPKHKQEEPGTAAAFGSVSPALKNNKKKKAPLTTANSDEQCLEHPDNFLARLWYQMSLMTGLYCLDKTERRISVTGASILFLLFLIQLVVFTKGVVDGILQTRRQEEEASMDVGDTSFTSVPNEIPMDTASANNLEL